MSTEVTNQSRYCFCVKLDWNLLNMPYSSLILAHFPALWSGLLWCISCLMYFTACLWLGGREGVMSCCMDKIQSVHSWGRRVVLHGSNPVIHKQTIEQDAVLKDGFEGHCHFMYSLVQPLFIIQVYNKGLHIITNMMV